MKFKGGGRVQQTQGFGIATSNEHLMSENDSPLLSLLPNKRIPIKNLITLI